MSDEFKKLIEKLMQDESEQILEEINSSPELRDIKAPEDIHDALFAQVRAYEEEKAYEKLSNEQKELLHLGKMYKKRRKLERIVLVVVALIGVLAYGTVSLGDGKGILTTISKIINGKEQKVINYGNTESKVYNTEAEIYEKIMESYDFSPVKLGYLPEGTTFYEGTFCEEMQSVNIIYELDEVAKIVFIIKPNYRETSFGVIIEDEKIQEYKLTVNNLEVEVVEYEIDESKENRWSICFEFEDVQYLLRITDMEQEEVERIINNLYF